MSNDLEQKEINKQLVKKPIYEYKTGQMIYLSQREQVLVDTYLKTQNVHECSRQIAVKCHRPVSVPTCWRWLQKKRIANYVVEEMKDTAIANGYTENKWIAEGIKAKNGDTMTKIDFQYWKELGKALGYHKSPDTLNQFNQQINFTQSDGEQ